MFFSLSNLNVIEFGQRGVGVGRVWGLGKREECVWKVDECTYKGYKERKVCVNRGI